jgi:hypothetical protein
MSSVELLADIKNLQTGFKNGIALYE